VEDLIHQGLFFICGDVCETEMVILLGTEEATPKEGR
jgi:hypothetical protein